MSNPLNRLSLAFAGAFLLVVLATGFWSYVRAEALTARGDNPRRILSERRVPRGKILDRNGQVLAEAVGTPGEYSRRYSYPGLSSVIGYVSPLYGTAGVEAAFDPVLHGDEGYDALELWQMGTVLGAPPPGRGVRLTLDLALQQAADAALGDRPGAVVLLNTATGEILALASHPAFDANTLDDTWSALVADPGSPLLNRAVLGLYQPGAALAPAMLTSALAMGAVELDQPANAGALTLGEHTYACRSTTLDGGVTLAEALREGCPLALSELGLSLGGGSLQSLFEALRLFEPPAIGLPAAAATADGAISDPALSALGQDKLAISPLQLALITAAIAEHGRLPAPQLVLATQGRDGQWHALAPAAAPTEALPPSAADEAAAWMADGYSATAVSNEAGTTLAWFTAFARGIEGHYAVAVLLESGEVEAAEAIGRAVLAAAER